MTRKNATSLMICDVYGLILMQGKNFQRNDFNSSLGMFTLVMFNVLILT